MTTRQVCRAPPLLCREARVAGPLVFHPRPGGASAGTPTTSPTPQVMGADSEPATQAQAGDQWRALSSGRTSFPAACNSYFSLFFEMSLFTDEVTFSTTCEPCAFKIMTVSFDSSLEGELSFRLVGSFDIGLRLLHDTVLHAGRELDRFLGWHFRHRDVCVACFGTDRWETLLLTCLTLSALFRRNVTVPSFALTTADSI